MPIRASSGVDVITGDGLAAALAGVETIVDAATGPSPEQEAATEFFTTAARNLHGRRAGRRAAHGRGVDHRDRPFAGGLRRGEGRPRAGQRCRARSRCASCAPRSSTSSSRSSWSGARRARSATCRRCARSWSRPGPSPRRSPTWPPRPTESRPTGAAPIPEIAGPQEEDLVDVASAVRARRGMTGSRSRRRATPTTRTPN